MKQELYKLIDAIVSQDEDGAKEHFGTYISAKTTALLSEAEQGDLFGDKVDKDASTKRYLTKPVGVAFDDLDQAKQVAKSHLDKDFSIVDTTTDEVVYSHKGNKKR